MAFGRLLEVICLSSGQNCGLDPYRQTDLHIIVPDILPSSLSINFFQINGMDIHLKCDFLSLKAIIYKDEFMEDCPVENPSLDGIL